MPTKRKISIFFGFGWRSIVSMFTARLPEWKDRFGSSKRRGANDHMGADNDRIISHFLEEYSQHTITLF